MFGFDIWMVQQTFLSSTLACCLIIVLDLNEYNKMKAELTGELLERVSIKDLALDPALKSFLELEERIREEERCLRSFISPLALCS